MERVIVGAAIVDGAKLLIQQRAYPDDAAGLWELPGGRVEPGETEQAALRRECAEELAIEVTVGVPVGEDVVLPGGAVLRIYAAALVSGCIPQAVEHKALRWIAADEVSDVDWLPADRALIPDLEELLA
ncbi:DNA mismatch repair protein MutT [Saccharomonospora sp. CUA-673]|uniref:(deoxy)nucleoside triphosphate pyrophosphohydrolase n=1 Tax=Saccharomonospora sp. CUA-673 TaxID=1904969 RepID=UPI0009594E43|nr:NUDIX domain-containing protein [Saccharomonospora sp. CUA-673]OLT42059.1 DNA mismatch repair protein MutT [Saccharomonospora sp. CUA-673]